MLLMVIAFLDRFARVDMDAQAFGKKRPPKPYIYATSLAANITMSGRYVMHDHDVIWTTGGSCRIAKHAHVSVHGHKGRVEIHITQ